MKQELLAPAGDIEAGYAALYYGADAVYLGLQKFSARATAANFDESALNEFTAYAHYLGRKVYVAINTVLQEGELPQLLETLDICSRCKADAVILQDLGVARVIRENYPELEMHASTQMAVHNWEGAKYLQSLGFSRVVVARELTLPEIKKIASIDGLETEAFIHGALCYSYSGLCQFSALEMGRSANRGKCLYPCRACFKGEQGNKHIFSMKDMALQDDILKMPVTSLKIEGRKKSALYVAAVTDYYRRILDGKGARTNLEENIKQIFSRPWCKFHFNGKNKNITDKNFVGHRGLLIGTIKQLVKGRLYLSTTHKIGRFDGLQIDIPGLEKPFGFSIQHLWVGGKKVFSADAGDNVEIALPEKYPHLKPGLNVYLSSSTTVKGAYAYNKPRPGSFVNRTNIKVVVEVFDDKILAKCNNFSFVVNGKFAKAQSAGKSSEAIKAAFSKTGGTPFMLENIEINNKHDLFVPVSAANELRRGLYSSIVLDVAPQALPAVLAPIVHNNPQWTVKVDNISYLQYLDISLFAEIIYLISPKSKPSDLVGLPKNKVRLALPAVCRSPQLFAKTVQAMLDAGYKKWEAANYWGLQMLPVQQIDICFDTPLYMLNSQAISMARQMGASGVAFALEDNLANIQQLALKAPLKTTFVVYQDAPLFISAGCIRNNDCKNCTGGEQWLDLEKDGKKYKAFSKDCQMMLFAETPLSFAKEARQIAADFYRIDFCYKPYEPENIEKIVSQLIKFEDVFFAAKGNINNQKI